MLKLYRFYWDCGRMGSLNGLFIADDAEVARFIGKKCYFGEGLWGTLEEGDLEIVTDDQDFIDKCRRYIDYNTLSGHNPILRMQDDEANGVYDEEESNGN